MAPSRELEDWERSAQAGFSRRPGHESRIFTSFWGGILDPRNNVNNYGGLGHGPYDNTLAANIAAGSRLVNAAPAGHWPREVSNWSLSSSSSSSEYDSDNDGSHSPDSNGNYKSRPRRKNKRSKRGKNKEKTQKEIKGYDDDVEEVIWIPESQRNSTFLQPQNSSQEVIYDLDERAMSKLPDHLQDNMREMQQERVERLQRENKNVPVRRYSDFKRQNWLKNLVQRLPPESSRSSTMGSTGSHDTDYTPNRSERQGQDGQLDEHEEDPDIIRPVCPGDVHEVYYEDTTGKYHGNAPGWYRRVGHGHGRRVHRAISTKDAFGYGGPGGSHLNEGPRRSEPCLALPYLRQTEENPDTTLSQGRPKQEADVNQEQHPLEQRQVAVDETSPRMQKKRSLFFPSPGMRARVKKSIYKLSKAFKKG